MIKFTWLPPEKDFERFIELFGFDMLKSYEDLEGLANHEKAALEKNGHQVVQRKFSLDYLLDETAERFQTYHPDADEVMAVLEEPLGDIEGDILRAGGMLRGGDG